MEQMNIEEQYKVHLNAADTLPRSFKEFNPVVFRQDNRYCCILGPDPQSGVFGCGATPEEAVRDWDKQLKALVDNHADDDPVAQYVLDTLQASKNKVW